MKKLNRKAMILPKDNIAVQNAAVAAGYAVYIIAAAVIASVLYITANVNKQNCNCSCRCASSLSSALAAAGYGNHAVTLARH